MRAFGSCGRRSGEKDGRENVAVVDLGVLGTLLPYLPQDPPFAAAARIRMIP